MKLFLIISLLLATSFHASSYPANSSPWAHRSVIYFAPTMDEHVKQFLLETLKNDCEMMDRDVITLVITEDGFTMPAWVKHEFDLKAMYLLYGIKEGSHTAILVGKDGAEKLRWFKKANWEKIKQIIDQTPNRRNETQGRADPCST